jgi:CheY-like chemotaxis protein
MTEENKYRYKKILVIDDTEIDRYIARRNITKYQFAEEVILYESAAKALEYLASLQNTPEELPQLIFLDILMPEMNGFEFLEAYSNLPDIIRKNCIIMMLSTSLSTSLNADDHAKAKSNKYVAKFVNKPLDKEALAQLEKPV